MIEAVLVGSSRRDGEVFELDEPTPYFKTPKLEGRSPWLTGGVDEMGPACVISSELWELVLSPDGWPTRDDEGRYRYKLKS